MAKMTEFDDALNKARIAREEFLAVYCWWWPAIYKAACPLTDDAANLLAWKRQIESAMQADFKDYQREQGNPYDDRPPLQTSFIDWKGVRGLDQYTEWAIREGNAHGKKRIKFGVGIDPADGEEKPFAEFHKVRADHEAAGLGELYKLNARDKELYDMLQTETDDKTIDRLKTERTSIAAKTVAIRRDYEIRVAGPNAESVKRLHQLQDEEMEASRNVYDETGRPKVAVDSDEYRTAFRLREQRMKLMRKLEKELGR